MNQTGVVTLNSWAVYSVNRVDQLIRPLYQNKMVRPTPSLSKSKEQVNSDNPHGLTMATKTPTVVFEIYTEMSGALLL